MLPIKAEVIKYKKLLFDTKPIIRIVVDIITLILDDKPSKPSSQLKAFIKPTIHDGRK